MGEALYAQLSEDHPEIACRTYAPVGSHRDLLAYLVRRLLENGANSSFVALAADEAVPVANVAAASGGYHRQRRQRPASQYPVAARSLSAAADKTRAASNSANAQRLNKLVCWRRRAEIMPATRSSISRCDAG